MSLMLRSPSTYVLADIVLIENFTNLHVGSGGAEGLVDLPIQRDEFGYPVLYSSSIKGSLKTCLLHTTTNNVVYVLFGPDPEEGETFESSIAILEGYLFAIPARSLRGVYVYVTSPILLKRFLERIELYAKFDQESLVNVDSVGQEAKDVIKKIQYSFQSLVEEARERLGVDNAICLGDKQEIEIKVKGPLEGCAVLVEEFVLKILEPKRGVDGELLDMLGFDKPLLLLHDDIAKEVIDRSLVRYTRIRLRRETKTVEEGGLWTEEYLPLKSKFHTVLLYKRPPLTDTFIRKILDRVEEVDDNAYLESLKKLGILSEGDIEELKNSKEEAQLLLAEKIRSYLHRRIENNLKSFIIMGGKETLGKGIVKLNFLTSKAGREVS